jgi:GTPase
MADLISTASKTTEDAVLIGVQLRGQPAWAVQDSLDELARLAETAGARVLERIVCRQDKPHPGLYIGSGKAEEIAGRVQDRKADLVIFDDDLTPAQGRNLEKILDVKLLDRSQLIMDIFARHAATREGCLQVELAQLFYTLPRLRRMWTHLERQRGGIGLRGPGEQQIEVDRRRIEQRITRIRNELDDVRSRRAEQRKGRRRHGWALLSFVGYTNAGKSTLLNRLTEAGTEAGDKLFATLDPTTRRLELPNHQPALLTDTVGFIRKLPHGLIEAFKATLEEVAEADLLVHVVDTPHPQVESQIEAVFQVLDELGAAAKPVLTVFNKIDVPEGRQRARSLSNRFRDWAAVSARTGEGCGDLLSAMADRLRHRSVTVRLTIPHREGRLLSLLHGAGHILKEEYGEDGVSVEARVPARLLGDCRPYLEEAPDES